MTFIVPVDCCFKGKQAFIERWCGLHLPLRHTPREAGAGAKEFIWSFADVFISMYANKINLIFKNWLFHKVEKASSSNGVQLFVSEKATTPGRDGKGLI